MQAASPLPAGTRWWILCRVVDNFGDAGVCWRLARQLAREHEAAVTLFIDRPELVDRLAGGTPTEAGIVVAPWPLAPWQGAAPAPDAVVSAFGCEPPDWIRAMLAGAPARPAWIHLEYLSAEPWVDGCHGLASVKPADGAVEHFFYPGFTAATGGLLRERDALAPADRPAGAERAAALARLCGRASLPGERVVSLFCYPDSPLEDLLPALAAGDRPTLLLVPEGIAPDAPEAFAGAGLAPDDPPAHRGNLRIARIRFLPQDGYDALLRLCDLNFVRGEDSWIRAHWARRPFVWQPYRQPDGAHHAKLDAFLARLRAAAVGATGAAAGDEPAATGEAKAVTSETKAAIGDAVDAIESLMRAWSGRGDAGAAWQDFERVAAPAESAFRRWTDSLLGQADLATNLAEWLRGRL